MIAIPYTNQNGGILLERSLTPEEESAVTHRHVTSTEVIFYTGDEPDNLKASNEAVVSESSGFDISNADLNSLTEVQIQTLKTILNLQ